MKYYLITTLIVASLTLDSYPMKRKSHQEEESTKNAQQHIVEIKRQKLNEADEKCEQNSNPTEKIVINKFQLLDLPQELLCYIFNKFLPNLSRSALGIIAQLDDAFKLMSSSKVLRQILESELIRHIQRNFSEYKNIRDYSGNNLFALAVIEGKYQIAWMLLQVFRNDDESMYEMLHYMKRTKDSFIFDPAVFNKIFAWAISNGYKEFADILCGFIKDNGKPFNFNFPDSDRSTGKSILHFAADNSDSECVQDLLSWKSDVNTQDNYGNTPLTYAIKRGHIDIVECLLRIGAEINYDDIHFTLTPFLHAIISGNATMVELLIQYGANINPNNEFEFIPLLCAKLAANGTESHREIISILKKESAVEKNFEDCSQEHKDSLLYWAVNNNWLKSIKMLVDIGASHEYDYQEFYDIEILNSLELAITKKNLEAVNLLLKKYNSIFEQDYILNDVYDIEMFDLLYLFICYRDGIKPKNDLPNIKFEALYQVLSNAIIIKAFNLFKRVVDLGIDLNKGLQYYLKLVIALSDQKMKSKMMKYLIKHGLDVDQDYSIYNTFSGNHEMSFPLYHAVQLECQTAVDLLIRNGADIYRMDQYGRTVFDLSCKNQQIKYLLNNAKNGHKN